MIIISDKPQIDIRVLVSNGLKFISVRFLIKWYRDDENI